MKFILAEKKEMTQKFAEDGAVIPVTKVLAEPCVVTQIKSKDNDGYVGVQVGCGRKRNLSKSVKGHLKKLGDFRYLKEFRLSEDEAKNIVIGAKIGPAAFSAGDIVKVTGISKGKGFQGVVKRHGFHGSPKTHGHKDQLRMPGSIGSTGPAHVFKGTRMGGRMGGDQVTVANLQVVEVNEANNEIFIKGAVPGHKNNLLMISGEGELVLLADRPVEAVETKVEDRPEEKSVEEKAPEAPKVEKVDEKEEEVPVSEEKEDNQEDKK